MDISTLQQNLKIAAAVLVQWTVQAFPLLCFIGIVDWERSAEGVGFVSVALVGVSEG